MRSVVYLYLPQSLHPQEPEWEVKKKKPKSKQYPLPRSSTSNILSQAISANLLPFHLHPCYRKLSPETLESALGQLGKGLVELFLVSPLDDGNLLDDVASAWVCASGGRKRLLGQQTDVPVFVIMHVDLDGTRQGARGGGDEELQSVAAVPGGIV